MEANLNSSKVASSNTAAPEAPVSTLRMLAVDIGGTNLKAALLIYGKLQQHREIPSEAKKVPPSCWSMCTS